MIHVVNSVTGIDTFDLTFHACELRGVVITIKSKLKNDFSGLDIRNYLYLKGY